MGIIVAFLVHIPTSRIDEVTEASPAVVRPLSHIIPHTAEQGDRPLPPRESVALVNLAVTVDLFGEVLGESIELLRCDIAPVFPRLMVAL